MHCSLCSQAAAATVFTMHDALSTKRDNDSLGLFENVEVLHPQVCNSIFMISRYPYCVTFHYCAAGGQRARTQDDGFVFLVNHMLTF